MNLGRIFYVAMLACMLWPRSTPAGPVETRFGLLDVVEGHDPGPEENGLSLNGNQIDGVEGNFDVKFNVRYETFSVAGSVWSDEAGKGGRGRVKVRGGIAGFRGRDSWYRMPVWSRCIARCCLRDNMSRAHRTKGILRKRSGRFFGRNRDLWFL